MINEMKCKKVCREDLSLIQNYEEAVSDRSQTWNCHHRLGLVIPRKKLNEMGLYFNRPAVELIFLKETDHKKLHSEHRSEEHKRKISEAQKGKKRPEITGEKNVNSKPVYQIDKNTGQIIRIWACSSEVQRKLGIAHNSISNCCNSKRKSAGGFVWKYANSCTPPYRQKPLF